MQSLPMQGELELLLFDQTEGDAQSLSAILAAVAEQGWHLTHIDHPDNLQPALRQTQFDLLLLNLDSPEDINRIQAIQTLTPQVPIVVLSQWQDPQLGLEALASGAQDYLLHQQVNADILTRVIRYAIERGQILHQLHSEVSERQRSEQTLRHLVQGTASVTGTDFFQALVRSLAQALNVRYALISGCIDSPPTKVCTYAFWQGDGFGENETYDLYGTPCEQVFSTQKCQYYPQNLQSLFPTEVALVEMEAESYAGIPLLSSTGEILGHLAVIDDEFLGNEERNTSILEIFAARAAAEIERQQVEAALRCSQAMLQQANQALEQLAEIGELAAMIVHEIRNPLTTLLMGLNTFKRLELTAKYQTYLEIALAEGERLQRLLNQILLYAKPHNLNLQTLDLQAQLTHWLDNLRTIPAGIGKHLVYQTDGLPSQIRADPDKLQQVIINLVTNAFEAVEPGQTITLSLEAPTPEWVTIQVQNGGCPIPAEILPKLTQPFVTTKAEGTGLGLAIVKRIVTAHGGELQIVSIAEGTTLTVILPLLL